MRELKFHSEKETLARLFCYHLGNKRRDSEFCKLVFVDKPLDDPNRDCTGYLTTKFHACLVIPIPSLRPRRQSVGTCCAACFPREIPLETLGYLWYSFTAFFRDPQMHYNETTAPEAWNLNNFRIGNTHKCHSRFRTPHAQIFLKGLQIVATIIIGLLAWDSTDRATASKCYAEAIQLAKTRPPFDCLGAGNQKPNEEVARNTKHFNYFVALQVKETKDNLATLIGNDIWQVGLAKAAEEILNTGNFTSPGLRREGVNVLLPVTRIEGDGTMRTVNNVMLASDGCANCGKRDVKLHRCSRCHKVAYCDAQCQRQNWKIHKATLCEEKTKV
ncbi:hypothetical protein D9758_007922 [Tetrapyrgos nigripes]|uniref:MYND-type domain-containing protein n=1 Tax=Tetrapyrgos nigripes TaxID=182062 RepID=A0A8H5D499_9AGAR|nr:hypothetical protein D9758_007922 [Tetrapyrgos nigripes]